MPPPAAGGFEKNLSTVRTLAKIAEPIVQRAPIMEER
jgi:hypothetical protein